jgi:chromosome segregation ATPase
VTTPASDIERKVRQLDNDVQSIYELLTNIQGTQRRQGTMLDGMDARMDRIETRLEGVETRLEGVETRLEGVETRLDGMDGKLDEVLRRLPPG